MIRKDLKPDEYNAYYGNYIKLVDENHQLIEALTAGEGKAIAFLSKIPQNKLKTSYARGKWTVLEVVQHIIDTERIFNYRALCIGRDDKTSLPGFEQDDYVGPSQANDRNLDSLIEEYKAVRASSISLFKNMDKNSLKKIGTASNSPLSARAAGFIIAGHELHHCTILKERYL